MNSLRRRFSIPAYILAGALIGSAVTGTAMAVQVHMQNALGDLQSAQSELNAALPDKAGWRIKALRAVSNAITFTNNGIAAGS
jgi:hypothetical protein